MPRRIAFTDRQLLDYSEEHLLYELQIVRWVVENLPPSSGFFRSALLESFSIHLRNLIYFFYTQPSYARPDDLVAADFFDPPSAWDLGPISKNLDAARERANKEVSHITYKRKGKTDPTKPWPVIDLFGEINAIALKFAAGASSKKLHPSVVRWLKADPKLAESLLFSASISSSNTTTSVVSSNWSTSSSSKTTVSGGQGGPPISRSRTP